MQKSGQKLQLKNRQFKRWFGLGIVILATTLGTRDVQAGNCELKTLNTWAFRESNEYLYPSVTDYEQNKYNAYECNKNACTDDDVVLVAGAHYVGNKRVDKSLFYSCSLGFDDKWEDFDIPACKAGECVAVCNYDGVIYGEDPVISRSAKEQISYITGAYKYNDLCTCSKEQIKKDRTEALKAEMESDLASWESWCKDSGGKYNKDYCMGLIADSVNIEEELDSDYVRFVQSYKAGKACQCPEGKEINNKLLCVPVEDGVEESYEESDTTPSGATPGCADKKHGDTCERGDATAAECVWYDKGEKTLTCAATACKEGTYLVVDKNGVSQGWCSAPISCPNGQTMKIIGKNKTDRTCINTEQVAAPTATSTPDQTSPTDQTPTFTEKSAKPTIPTTKEACDKAPGYKWLDGKCITDAEYNQAMARKKQEQEKATKEVETAMSAIEAMEKTDSFKENKWKNAEGRFNAARLASDSIAGVVLGTAGGLITSTVVKKTQIKKGFEDISCTIGGQTVADWGDEFTVGVK